MVAKFHTPVLNLTLISDELINNNKYFTDKGSSKFSCMLMYMATNGIRAGIANKIMWWVYLIRFLDKK